MFENKQNKLEGVDGVTDVCMDIPRRDEFGELHAEMIQPATQERIQECVSRDIFDGPVPRVMEETIQVVTVSTRAGADFHGRDGGGDSVGAVRAAPRVQRRVKSTGSCKELSVTHLEENEIPLPK